MQEFHDIFFKLSPKTRVNIIKVDREIMAQKESRETTTSLEAVGKKKRISAVTMAKLQQKQQIQQLFNWTLGSFQ